MRSRFIPFVILTIALTQCKSDDEQTSQDAGALFDDTPYALEYPNFPPPPGLEADNELTIQGVELGRMLFYEKSLSKNNSISCASCHRQEHAFTDTARFSTGAEGQLGNRHAMTIFNNAWHVNRFFWDGRADLLRDQALMPIQDPLEMNEDLDNVIGKLESRQMYLDQFARAFGTFEITAEKMGLAMEQFMQSIVSIDSKYDRFIQSTIELSESEERGRSIFFTNVNPNNPDNPGGSCFRCHTGPNFENDAFMNNGLDSDASITDYGRELVTDNLNDRGKFKVMSMRNIAVSPPFMHDGRFGTLEEVVEFYNSGIQASATLHNNLNNAQQNTMGFSEQDKTDLVNFLRTLTDDTMLSEPAYGSPF